MAKQGTYRDRAMVEAFTLDSILLLYVAPFSFVPHRREGAVYQGSIFTYTLFVNN
jgi:hypothetical protein